MSTLNTTNLKNPSSGSNNIVLNTDGTTTVPTLSSTTITGTTIQGTIKQGTSVASTSGTSIDFTGIPSWVKRITVMLKGVSTNGSSNLLVQLGTSGGVATSNYISTSTIQTGGTVASSTAGFIVTANNGSGEILSGIILISLFAADDWVSSATLKSSTSALRYSAGESALGATLTQVRITTVNGTDTFDAGSVNILFEG